MARPIFTYRFYSPKLRQFVAANHPGEKRRIKIRINYAALKKEGERRSKIAKKKRNEKKKKATQKKLAGKRSAAARKTGLRSRKGRKPDTRVYEIPFLAERTDRGIVWGVEYDAIREAYQIEKGWSKKNPPEVRGWMSVGFKDSPGDDIWIPADFSSLADEPMGAEQMTDSINIKLQEYEVAQVYAVELQVFYAEEI